MMPAFYASIYPNFCSMIGFLTVWKRFASNFASPPQYWKQSMVPKQVNRMQKLIFWKEVNRFVGWAISNLIKKTRKRFNRSKGPPKKVDEEELIGRLGLLKSMRLFEQEILEDEEYIEQFYCPFHRLLNDGFLALVSPKYVGLGLSLLQTFADAMNENELNKNGDETMKKAVAAAKDTKGPLKRSFLELCNDNDCLTVKQK
jgi:hypothetical protein